MLKNSIERKMKDRIRRKGVRAEMMEEMNGLKKKMGKNTNESVKMNKSVKNR